MYLEYSLWGCQGAGGRSKVLRVSRSTTLVSVLSLLTPGRGVFVSSGLLSTKGGSGIR